MPVFSTERLVGAFVSPRGEDNAQDPSSKMLFDQARHLGQTSTEPYLYGAVGVAAYSRAYSRWLPVPPSWVSPDGRQYAFAEESRQQAGTTRIHLTEVASGSDRVVYEGQAPDGYEVVAYLADGIYVAQSGQGRNGLWRIDPATGRLSQVAAPAPANLGRRQSWDRLAGRAAWTTEADRTRPVLQQGGPIHDRLARLDLNDGTVNAWLYLPGVSLAVIGTDQEGHPFVQVSTGESVRVLLVTAPEVSRQVYSGPGVGSADLVDFHSQWGSVADSQGVWFGATKGLFHYAPGGSLQRVSTVPGMAAGGLPQGCAI